MSSRGWEHATLNDVRDRRTVQKPSKYRNVRVRVGSLSFDSKREAARYQDLRAMEHAGQISDLMCQVHYPLYAPDLRREGIRLVVSQYIADFVYRENGSIVVEDVKGGKVTQLYALKRKWLELQSGIVIREVR